MATDLPIIETEVSALPQPRSARQLSFTSRRVDGGINLWSPTEVGDDRAEQSRVGREYGRKAADYIRARNNGAMLPGVVRKIVERGSFGGLEVGFFAALSMILADVA